MNLPADAPFVSRPAPRLAAGVLALGVHVVFVLLLVFGVSWQTQHPAPVMVDLWETLPKVAPSVAVKPPEPPPPLPVKTPEPVKAAPAPKPVVDEPPLPKAPDIALEKKKAEAERLQKLKAIQAEEEQARAEAARKAHEKQLAEQKKRELLRQMEEDLMQRTADEEAASAALAMKQAAERAAAGKRQAELARVVGQHRDQISAKVRGNTRLPDNLKGNPEVRCLVKLLPTGEVLSVRVTKSSGDPAYDDAVVRAIEKSSPLPLPNDRDARAAFVPELSFVHRPKE